MSLEKRTAFFESKFRASGETSEGDMPDKIFLEGYFIRYGEETELYPGCLEEINKGAAGESIKANDVRCLFDHDTGQVLGRTSNGTLTLTEDDEGIYGKVEINRDDPQAMSVYAKVMRGDVNACSFGFYITEQTDEYRDDGTAKFNLVAVDVFEVSIVTFPAYPTTDISARAKDVEKLKAKTVQARKTKLKERLQNGN